MSSPNPADLPLAQQGPISAFYGHDFGQTPLRALPGLRGGAGRRISLAEKLRPLEEKRARERQGTSGPGELGGKPLPQVLAEGDRLDREVNAKVADAAGVGGAVGESYRARLAIAEAASVDEVKDIRNQLARRNLTAAQRITLAEKLRPFEKKRAQEQQLATLKKGDEAPVPQVLGERDEHKREVDAKVAKAAGVSRETVRKHKVIQKEGTPEMKAAVTTGKVSIDAAYKKTRSSQTGPGGR